MKSEDQVFVVDDNDDFRSSVAWMLRGEGYKTVEFINGSKAITALRLADRADLHRSCLLLDVRMPQMSGLEFHELLKQSNITIPIIYMTGHADVPLAVEAMKKGAVTLLEKPLKRDQLTSAIETAINPSLSKDTDFVTSNISHADCRDFIERLGLLTPREKEVLDGIVEGQVNKVIASKFNISVRTVEVHRARLMKKLNIRSASEAVRFVLSCQL